MYFTLQAMSTSYLPVENIYKALSVYNQPVENIYKAKSAFKRTA